MTSIPKFEYERPSEQFNVEETVMLYESIPGYRTSGALLSNQIVEAGTYTVYQVANNARHPVKISSPTNTSGIWIDTSKLYKQPSGFFVGDSVYVSEETKGYDASTSSEVKTTVEPGYYLVYQTADGSKHPVNLSSDGKTAGIWVDSSSLTLQEKPPLYQEGETVVVMKSTPGYKTETAPKQASFVPKGTYYIKQYIEGATHPLKLASKRESDGVWVDLANIKKLSITE